MVEGEGGGGFVDFVFLVGDSLDVYWIIFLLLGEWWC